MYLLLGLVAMATSAQAFEGEAILGPGLGSARTEYYQTWDRTLSPDTLYTLTGFYYVANGHRINIPSGCVVQGDSVSTLIIQPGAQIFAEGTEGRPVVFTSRKPAGQRAPGDWGGVIVLGNAPVNQVNPVIEGGIIAGTYGGNDPEDNSGVIKYVRIEYPGTRYQLNNEVNGLTMGGVGRGTELHHVQVSRSFDDSFEWFGGTVDGKYLVCVGGTDDEFDTDFGYTGNLQFLFGMKDPLTWDAAGESNGFESDNDATGTTADPRTRPVFCNVTLLGPERTDALVGTLPPTHKHRNCALLRRSTRTSIYNSALIGYTRGFSIRDANTIADCTNELLRVKNVSITATWQGDQAGCVHETSRWAGVAQWFDTPTYANLGTAPRNPSTVGLTDVSDFNNPNPAPLAGSELDGSASFTDSDLSDPFFTAVTYRGAFEPGLPMDQQWTAHWTNFAPQMIDYTIVAVEETGELPGAAASVIAYPNPFNPSTTLKFNVPRAGKVSLKVFDVRGRMVADLHDGDLPAGAFQTLFCGENLPSGAYFARLDGEGFNVVQKMQMVK
jgi:hypothetical protein